MHRGISCAKSRSERIWQVGNANLELSLGGIGDVSQEQENAKEDMDGRMLIDLILNLNWPSKI